jgi:hypothetical protein
MLSVGKISCCVISWADNAPTFVFSNSELRINQPMPLEALALIFLGENRDVTYLLMGCSVVF